MLLDAETDLDEGIYFNSMLSLFSLQYLNVFHNVSISGYMIVILRMCHGKAEVCSTVSLCIIFYKLSSGGVLLDEFL